MAERENMDVIIFEGLAYTRLPASKSKSSRRYYIHNRKRLHVAIYESIHGPLPKGMVVHHKDLNPLNNDPENLVAMTDGEHVRLHSELTSQENAKRMLETLSKTSYERKCPVCGLEFRCKGSRRIYCSDGCRQRDQYDKWKRNALAEGRRYIPHLGRRKEVRTMEPALPLRRDVE